MLGVLSECVRWVCNTHAGSPKLDVLLTKHSCVHTPALGPCQHRWERIDKALEIMAADQNTCLDLGQVNSSRAHGEGAYQAIVDPSG